MSKYKVCIMAAGRGTRVSHSKYINKALLPVGNVAVLSRIISRFPQEIEVVIACGYQAEQIKNFAALAHPDRKITFVDVDNWSGPGSGPGYSLLACRPHLPGPFIFTGADTLVEEDVPEPDHNWIGVARVAETKDFLVAETKDGHVTQFHDKVDRAPTDLAFIGLAGVKDAEKFWKSLEGSQEELVQGELQVANGLQGLLDQSLATKNFTWFDTGNDRTYAATREKFTEVVAPKENEQLYIQDKRVVKFFADEEVATNRVRRARGLLGVSPVITGHQGQFYSYTKVSGELLSNVDDDQIFHEFLEFCETTLWRRVELDAQAAHDFQARCLSFYQDKTIQRIAKFYKANDQEDVEHVINGRTVPTLSHLLAQVDWASLADGEAVNFHGDLQPENIIVESDGGFTLIDWRQDFAGLLDYGDIYYDLAKLDHALLVNGEIIRQNKFKVGKSRGEISYEFVTRPHLLRYRSFLHDFIVKNNLSLAKVKTLSALIYLNIAPLHHIPYNFLLYYLGKDSLFQTLTDDHTTIPNHNRNATAIRD